LNHKYQTYDFVRNKEKEFLKFDKKEMPVWDAFQFLNQLVDDSDPDTDLDQFQHLLQTSEAIRKDGHPDWMVMVGLLHDMGKVLCLFDEPQWAVVGDTFPVGCAFSDKIVYPITIMSYTTPSMVFIPLIAAFGMFICHGDMMSMFTRW
jgi:inositol oxygenase